MLKFLRVALAGAMLWLAAAAAGLPAGADDLPAPAGEPLLTVSGSIARTNRAQKAVFDRDMLEKLPRRTVVTNTVWTDGVQTFEGVPLREVLKAVGATGTIVQAAALNDYAIDIPLDEPAVDDALIADRLNGEPMPVRNKGPLWIVFPFDQKAGLRREVVYSYSIWQLYELRVR